MKLALLSKSYFPVLGGTVTYIHSLAIEFQNAGHEVILVTRTKKTDDLPQDINYECVHLPNSQKLWDIAKWCDIALQVDSSWSDIWPFLLLRKPWFPTLHRSFPKNDESSGFEYHLRILGEKIAYRIGNTIAVSNAVKESWRLKCQVIPNPYQDDIFHYHEEINSTHQFLFVGRVTASKGVLMLVECLLELAEQYPNKDVSLGIVGSGNAEEALERLTACAPRNLKVTYYGRKHSSEVAALMNKSITLAFPTLGTWGEASPLTPLEAQACGCRVIASDNGGTKENLGANTSLYTESSAVNLTKHLKNNLFSEKLSIHEIDHEFLATRKMSVTAQMYIQLFEKHLTKSTI